MVATTHRHRRSRTALLWVGLLLCSCWTAALATDLVLVSDTASPLHRQFVEDFVNAWPGSSDAIVAVDGNPRNTTLTQQIGELAPRFVVAVGSVAGDRLAKFSGVPVIHMLITRNHFERLYGNNTQARRRSALYLDQPIRRQLELLTLVLPKRRHLGILAGAIGPSYLRDWQRQARAAGFTLTVHALDDEPFAKAVDTLAAQVDVMLALPDPEVVNPAHIKSLILATYRHGVPLVGYSAALVKAGALMTVYSDPNELAREGAAFAHQAMLSGRLPAPRYPQDYSVVVNYQIARALGLDVADEKSLTKALHERDD